MKKFFSFFSFFVFICPIVALADDIEKGDSNIVSITEKYYKTTTVLSNVQTSLLSENGSNGKYISYTEEISEKEYENFDGNENSPSSSLMTVETTYKKMITSIEKNGSYYRYKVQLNWKNMPKIRSYDVIAIGHYASVEPRSSIYFSQKYCTSLNDCTTSTSSTIKRTSTGTGAVFKLPSGDFMSLSQVLYFDVQKAVDATVIRQKVVGDYSHATEDISSSIANSFEINLNGITFSATNEEYFDDINTAVASWEGSW